MTGPGRAPSGTVTCLFSDIEGSTKLELEVGTGPYRDIRERHRAKRNLIKRLDERSWAPLSGANTPEARSAKRAAVHARAS